MPAQQEQNVKMTAKRKRRIASAKGVVREQKKKREARQEDNEPNTGMQAFEVLGQFATGGRVGIPKFRRRRSGN